MLEKPYIHMQKKNLGTDLSQKKKKKNPHRHKYKMQNYKTDSR